MDIDTFREHYNNLQENLELFLPENVSTGNARRASFGAAPIPQKVTASEAERIRRAARNANRQPESEPERAPRYPNPVIPLPSRGIGPDEPLLRTKSGVKTNKDGSPAKKRGTTPKKTAEYRATLFTTGNDRRPAGKNDRSSVYRAPVTPETEEKARRIGRALKNVDNWGTPEARAVTEHLISRGYADTHEAALAILESMSDEWFEGILFEGKKPLPIDKMLNQLQRHSYYSGWNRGGAEENRWNRAKREENSRKTEATANKRAAGIKKVISQHFNSKQLELFERNKFERESEKKTGIQYDRRDLEHIRNQRHNSISGGSPSHAEDSREHNASTDERREFNQGKYQKNIRKNHHKGVRVNTLLVGKEGDQIPVTNITKQYSKGSITAPQNYHLGSLRRRKLERMFKR